VRAHVIALLHKLSSNYCFARLISELSTDLLACANAFREAIPIRDGILSLSSAGYLNIDELNCHIESLAVDLN